MRKPNANLWPDLPVELVQSAPNGSLDLHGLDGHAGTSGDRDRHRGDRPGSGPGEGAVRVRRLRSRRTALRLGAGRRRPRSDTHVYLVFDGKHKGVLHLLRCDGSAE